MSDNQYEDGYNDGYHVGYEDATNNKSSSEEARINELEIELDTMTKLYDKEQDNYYNSEKELEKLSNLYDTLQSNMIYIIEDYKDQIQQLKRQINSLRMMNGKLPKTTE